MHFEVKVTASHELPFSFLLFLFISRTGKHLPNINTV
jgi:hypothetical protein